MCNMDAYEHLYQASLIRILLDSICIFKNVLVGKDRLGIFAIHPKPNVTRQYERTSEIIPLDIQCTCIIKLLFKPADFVIPVFVNPPCCEQDIVVMVSHRYICMLS